MKKFIIVILAAALPLLIGTCDLTLDTDESADNPQANGVIIYISNGDILNGGEYEIVAKRSQQLYATSSSGGVIGWASSNSAIAEVDETGLVRVGQALGKTATITAFIQSNPEIKAEVTFLVRDLR